VGRFESAEFSGLPVSEDAQGCANPGMGVRERTLPTAVDSSRIGSRLP
jgi:hypothetical protein